MKAIHLKKKSCSFTQNEAKNDNDYEEEERGMTEDERANMEY
jgi:hypothetical protein